MEASYLGIDSQWGLHERDVIQGASMGQEIRPNQFEAQRF